MPDAAVHCLQCQGKTVPTLICAKPGLLDRAARYVVLSRVKSASGLQLLGEFPKEILFYANDDMLERADMAMLRRHRDTMTRLGLQSAIDPGTALPPALSDSSARTK